MTWTVYTLEWRNTSFITMMMMIMIITLSTIIVKNRQAGSFMYSCRTRVHTVPLFFINYVMSEQKIQKHVKLFKGLVLAATLFLFILPASVSYIYNHIHTVHSSISIRRSLSPFLHCLLLGGKNLPGVPRCDSNSGLPYNKQASALPTEPPSTQLSYAAPY